MECPLICGVLDVYWQNYMLGFLCFQEKTNRNRFKCSWKF
jgi:hypothetical protein